MCRHTRLWIPCGDMKEKDWEKKTIAEPSLWPSDLLSCSQMMTTDGWCPLSPCLTGDEKSPTLKLTQGHPLIHTASVAPATHYHANDYMHSSLRERNDTLNVPTEDKIRKLSENEWKMILRVISQAGVLWIERYQFFMSQRQDDRMIHTDL